MIRIGVIGAGFARQAHIPGFGVVPNAMVTGVASRDYGKAQQVARDFSLPRCFETWQELVRSPEVDAVSVATPPAVQEEVVLAAISMNKAVLCEKPLSLDAGGASRMLQAARAAHVVHMVDFEFREAPAFRFARRLVESGYLGRIQYANISWTVDSWANPARPASWRTNAAEGGGALGAFGAHLLDCIEWLVGPIESVAAHLSTQIQQRPNSLGEPTKVTGEDCSSLQLELELGVPVSVALSTIAKVGKGLWIEINGERNQIVLSSVDAVNYGKGFTVWRGDAIQKRFETLSVPAEFNLRHEFQDGRVGLFASLAQRFIDAIERDDLNARPSFEEGYRVQMVLDAAREASRTGSRTRVTALKEEM